MAESGTIFEQSENERFYGCAVRLVPFNADFNVELERAPNVSGAPGAWTSLGVYTFPHNGPAVFFDLAPRAGVRVWYRARHVRTGWDPGPYHPPIQAVGRLLSRALFSDVPPLTIGGATDRPALGRTVFRETFDARNVLERYLVRVNLGQVIYPLDGQAGGRVLQADRYLAAEWPDNIPFDPEGLYRLRLRYRRAASAGGPAAGIYFGFVGVAADGTTLVNVNGANTFSGAHWVGGNLLPQAGLTLGTWYEQTAWVRGWSAVGVDGAFTPSLDPTAPRTLHANVRYIRPAFIVNYDAGTDAIQLDDFSIDLFDEDAANRLYESVAGAGVLDPATAQTDGASSRVLMRGLQQFTAQDGDTITFAPAYNGPPRSRVSGGAVYSSALASPIYEDKRLTNVTATSATVVARLRSPGAPTAQAHDFSGGIIATNEAVTLTAAPASNDQYTVRAHYFLEGRTKNGVGLVFLTWAIDSSSDAGSSWTQRATVTQTLDIDTALSSTSGFVDTVVAVSGLDGTDRLRIRLVEWNTVGNIQTANAWVRGADNGTYAGRGVSYTTSTDTTVAATTAANRVTVETWAG